MSYIGNAPTTAAFLTDTFSGTGSQTAYTMTVAPANTSSILVSVTGVLQSPDTYSVSGTTLTFSAAPPSGTSNISVRYLGIPASGVTTTAYRTVTEFTATSGQTSFSVPSYTVGYIDVYRNGVMLGTADFTATTGTTVVLASGATTGDLIRTESFYVSSVLNAIQQYNGSSTNQTLTLPTIDNIKMGYTTTATAAGTTTLTSASNHQQFFTGTTTQTVVLPVTSTLALGLSYSIENNSTGTVTVTSSGGNTITTIPAGITTLFTCILTSGTTAASWDYDQIGFVAITGTGSVALASLPTFTTTIGVGGATASALGSGITFPATQSASSDANTLDDYEEGTFSPSITFGGGSTGISYSSQVGRYTKIGKCVTFNLYCAMSSKGSSTGVFLINGLPFTSQSTTAGYNTLTLWTNNTPNTLTGIVEGYVAPSTTSVTFEYMSTGFYGTLAGFTNSQCNNNSDFMVGGMYYTT